MPHCIYSIYSNVQVTLSKKYAHVFQNILVSLLLIEKTVRIENCGKNDTEMNTLK